MSRVGKSPIDIPSGVEIKREGNKVTIKGPKGELSREFSPRIDIDVADGKILVKRRSDARDDRSMHGLVRSLLANMVKGVTDGFEKTLEIQGVGYKALKKGNNVELALGFSHLVLVEPEPGVEIDVINPTRLVVKGIDKERVGLMAAHIRAYREPEPYKGKGIRYEGEYVRRKAGKAAKA